MKLSYLFFILILVAVEVNADNSTLDAAIGGGIGGAAGAAIGNEIGGRDGAIIGGSLGAAIGTIINTDQHAHPITPHRKPPYIYGYPQNIYPSYDYSKSQSHPGYHCPPGQAKKGRC